MQQHHDGSTARFARRFAEAAMEVVLETLWPTRCAVCDLQGDKVLCDRCRAALVQIDDLFACEKCGAPFGRVQCTECNDVRLQESGLEKLPFERMRHSVVLDEAAKKIVAVYKDHDERRLADAIAAIMAFKVRPEAQSERFSVSYIPDTKDAYRRRGFDHSEEIAEKLASICGLECAGVFSRPKSTDQRVLNRKERIANMQSALELKARVDIPKNVLLVDDVCTTGATIYSACNALLSAGAERIHVLTFGLVLE